MTPRQIAAAHARRRRTALACVKHLDKAADALRDFLSACNACQDESASLSAQGKGRDGREVLIADLAEFGSYLASKYARE